MPHYNFVGESVLGYKAHLGAGATCSNWKLMPSNVVIQVDGKKVQSAQRPARLLPLPLQPVARPFGRRRMRCSSSASHGKGGA